MTEVFAPEEFYPGQKKANSAVPPYARSRSYATTETKFPVLAVRRRHARLLGVAIVSMYAYLLEPS